MSGSSVKAIITKELRENLQWAMLACGIVLGFLALALYKQNNTGITITGYLFPKVYALICPAVGLVLGLVQMLPDMRRGRWQFVTHRPISRGGLLIRKILVGFALYFIAAGLPLAMIVIWIATPGHVPGPFAWDMLSPLWRFFLSGLPWYAAGLLVACRSGRWLGSRLIPIGGVLMASSLWIGEASAINVRGWIFLLSPPVIVTIVILSAVWGAYINGGDMSQSPWWAKAALGCTLIAGWSILIAIGTIFAQAAAGPRFWPWEQVNRFPLYGVAAYGPHETVKFARNGWLNIWKLDRYFMLDFSNRSLDENPFNIDESRNSSLELSTTLIDTTGHWGTPSLKRLFDGFDNQHNWFYVRERGTIEGYDVKTCRYIGSIGLGGFSGPSVSPVPFPRNFEPQPSLNLDDLLVYSDVIYHLHFVSPGIQKVFIAKPGDPIIGAGAMLSRGALSSEDLDSADLHVAVETRNTIHIIHGSREVRSISIEGKSPNSSVAVAEMDSGKFMVAYFSNDPIRLTVIRNVITYNADGTLDQKIVDLEEPSEFFERPLQSTTDWVKICGLTGFSPVQLIATVQSIQRRGEAAPAYVMMICLVSLLCGAASAFGAASVMRAHHANRRQSYVWIALCAAFGLVGILVMLSMLDRVQSIRCSKCGKRCLVEESECPHCGAAAAGPEMRGIEILEPALVAG